MLSLSRLLRQIKEICMHPIGQILQVCDKICETYLQKVSCFSQTEAFSQIVASSGRHRLGAWFDV